MITLYQARTGAALGSVTEAQFQQLSDQLEEEWVGDQDYYVNQDTIDLLQAQGVSNEVITLLQQAIAETGEADIQWARAQ